MNTVKQQLLFDMVAITFFIADADKMNVLNKANDMEFKTLYQGVPFRNDKKKGRY